VKRALAAIVLLSLAAPALAEAGCREMDVARGLARAYAAEADAAIQYFGHNFFLIVTRRGTRIVTDPLGPGWYPTPDVTADLVTVGREHYNHNYVAIVRGKPLILRGLAHHGAEWNRVSLSYRDVFVYNVPIYQNAGDGGPLKGAAFVFDLGALCIAHLGDLSHPLTPEQLKQMGRVDVALTPIGGTFTMGPDVARQVLEQLKPKIAIPMHYRDNPYLVQQFTQGVKTRRLDGDTLHVSKATLPRALEIVVLRQRGARMFD
jgi:L-ascorbate metabolism protein UlaG (beta-lactamase superfamily)